MDLPDQDGIVPTRMPYSHAVVKPATVPVIVSAADPLNDAFIEETEDDNPVCTPVNDENSPASMPPVSKQPPSDDENSPASDSPASEQPPSDDDQSRSARTSVSSERPSSRYVLPPRQTQNRMTTASVESEDGAVDSDSQKLSAEPSSRDDDTVFLLHFVFDYTCYTLLFHTRCINTNRLTICTFSSLR